MFGIVGNSSFIFKTNKFIYLYLKNEQTSQFIAFSVKFNEMF